jgi:osmotically-inducible protein OsmY
MTDDKQLKQAVLDELNWEPAVDAAHIGVTARNGVVTLTGHVGKYAEKSAAEAAVKRVKGVSALAEELEVRLSLEARRDDEAIASAAADRLKWNTLIPNGSVRVKVDKGWVTLTGDVPGHYQRDAAVTDIASLWGVIGVSNQVTVKPTASAADVRQDITTALHRSWYEPMNIDVAVHGGAVTLTGTVNGWSERAQAGTTAWAAPGITSVVNNIHVH